MLFLLLGAATLGVLLWALGGFSRARITTVKSFGVWVVTIGGLLLAAMLFLTGRGASAIAAIVMFAPLAWSWLKPTKRVAGGARERPAPRPAAMTRAEAYAVLGLAPGADAEAIRAAHRRLMRVAHPDGGGSDWLASRVNQARDLLLG